MTRPSNSNTLNRRESADSTKNKNKESAERAHSKTNILNKKSVVNNLSTVDSFLLKETKSFSFRVPIIYIKKYKELNELQQELVREILKAAFIKALEQVSGVKLEQQRVINVVMPVQVNVNVAKAEALSSDSVLLKRLRELKQRLKEYSEMIREYEAEISRLRKELSERDERIKELESQLSRLRPEVVARAKEEEVVRRLKNVLIRLTRKGIISREQLSAIYTEMGW